MQTSELQSLGGLNISGEQQWAGQGGGQTRICHQGPQIMAGSAPNNIPAHSGLCPATTLAHSRCCQWPLVGRGRRSSISSSRLQPTSPCTSAGSQRPTTARCSLPTRWTSATGAPSSRARPSSSPRVSALGCACRDMQAPLPYSGPSLAVLMEVAGPWGCRALRLAPEPSLRLLTGV